MLDKIVDLVPVVLTVLGGLIVALAAVAPLTKSEVDNKILAGLRKLVAVLSGFIGHKAK